jgi:Alginate export
MRKGILSTALFLILGVYAYGQFTLDGEVRPRFEYRRGYKSIADSAQDNAAFVEQRTRLNFGYKTEGYIFKVALQYINVWGSQPQLINNYSKLNSDGSYFDFHEAWAQALMTKNLSLKFGRQEIILDDHRIFGSVGWTQQARSHDAVILKFKKNKFKADFAAAYNQDKAALAKTEAQFGSYKAFQYLWLHNDFGKNFGVSVLFLNNGKEQVDSTRYDTAPATAYYKDNYSQTAGTRLTFKKNKLSINGAFYAQMGRDGNRGVYYSDYDGKYNKEISAMNYSLDVNYKITKKFSAGVGYEYLSGNSQTDTSASNARTNNAFNPLYGTNHKFNGFMDYFYVGNWTKPTDNVGLQDIIFRLKYKAEKFWIGADVHMFSAANDVWDGYKFSDDINTQNNIIADPNSTATQITAAANEITAINDKKYTDYTMSAGLGTEIDLTFGFNLAKGVAFKGGYSVMMGTETLAYLKGTTYGGNNTNAGQGRTDQNSSWGWAMIIVKPSFIGGKKAEPKKTEPKVEAK